MTTLELGVVVAVLSALTALAIALHHTYAKAVEAQMKDLDRRLILLEQAEMRVVNFKLEELTKRLALEEQLRGHDHRKRL